MFLLKPGLLLAETEMLPQGRCDAAVVGNKRCHFPHQGLDAVLVKFLLSIRATVSMDLVADVNVTGHDVFHCSEMGRRRMLH